MWLVTYSSGWRPAKRSLVAWVVVIPKERWVRVVNELSKSCQYWPFLGFQGCHSDSAFFNNQNFIIFLWECANNDSFDNFLDDNYKAVLVTMDLITRWQPCVLCVRDFFAYRGPSGKCIAIDCGVQNAAASLCEPVITLSLQTKHVHWGPQRNQHR